MTTTVKHFFSTDTGASTCTGQAGSLADLLYSILSTGFNLKNITITQAAGVATASCNSHGFRAGQVLLIAGADQAAYNGEVEVLTVPTAGSFTFAVASGTASPATGSISAKVAPAGWTRVYSNASPAKAVWKSADVTSSGLLLRIDDSAAQYAALTAYCAMSDIDTGTESWHSGFWKKSSTSDATARPWLAVADSKTLHLFIGWNQTVGATPMYSYYVFGDFASLVPADAYNCLLSAHSANNPAGVGVDVGVLCVGNLGSSLSTAAAAKVARNLYFDASSPRFLLARSAAGGLSVGNTASGADTASWTGAQPGYNGLTFDIVRLHEYDAVAVRKPMRGVMRGLLHIDEYQPSVDVNGYRILAGIIGLSGKNSVMVKVGVGTGPTDSRVAVDIKGPWT